MGADRKRHRKLRKALISKGWRERATGSSHFLLYCPCGEHTTTIPDSPGDGRAWKNSISDLRRTKCEFLPAQALR